MKSGSSKAALHPRTTTTIPASSTTGNAVMKGKLNKYGRARVGAQAVAGGLLIKPTVAMIARALETSEYLIKCALLRTRIPTPAQADAVWWNAKTEAERTAFFDAHRSDVNAWLDRVTRPDVRRVA